MQAKKIVSGVSGAAFVAAGLGSLILAAPANAACASVGQGLTVGDPSQCSATIGNIAIVPDKGEAHVLGGFGNTAFAWGDYATAVVGSGVPAVDALNLFNVSLAGGTWTSARTIGIGNGAADLGENDAPIYGIVPQGSATAVGSLNRVVNIGGNNTGVAGNLPNLETLALGGNTVFNLGTNNISTAGKTAQLGPFILPNPDDKTNLSAAVSIFNLNKAQVEGNNSGAIAVGEGRVVDAPVYQKVVQSLVPQTYKKTEYNTAKVNGNNSLAAAVGQWNTAKVVGNNSGANATGTDNESKTFGNNSMTGTFGTESRSKVKGNNSLATVFGDRSRARVFANRSLAGVFGNKSRATTTKDDGLSAAVGDNKHATNEVK